MEQTLFLLCFLNLNIQTQSVQKTKDTSPVWEVLRELWHTFQGHKLLKDWLISIMLFIPECAHMKKVIMRSKGFGNWVLQHLAFYVVCITSREKSRTLHFLYTLDVCVYIYWHLYNCSSKCHYELSRAGKKFHWFQLWKQM